MANLTPLISENLGMEMAPIEHIDEGRCHRVTVGQAVDVDIEDVGVAFRPRSAAAELRPDQTPANSDLTSARTLSARGPGLGFECPQMARSLQGSNLPGSDPATASSSDFGRMGHDVPAAGSDGRGGVVGADAVMASRGRAQPTGPRSRWFDGGPALPGCRSRRRVRVVLRPFAAANTSLILIYPGLVCRCRR